MPEGGSSFAARLKSLRESAGLTQQELADRAGMHKLGVAKLEQGLREPTWATVQALAKALGVTCLDFVAGDGEAEARQAPALGRPRKAPAEGADRAGVKRPRGRPKKPPPAAQRERSGDGLTQGPSGEKKDSAGKGRKRKGKGQS